MNNSEDSTGNVFADLGLDNPEELLATAKLLSEIRTLIKVKKLSHQDVAKKLGINQPQASLLVSGQLSAFTSDTLAKYLSTLKSTTK